MNTPASLPTALALSGALLCAASAVEASEEDPYTGNACIECHRDLPGRSSAIVELEWKQSVHHAARVGCEGCHGGNAAVKREAYDTLEAWKRAAHLSRDPEFALVHQSDSAFVSEVRGRSVSYFCGKCHADIKEKHLGSPHGEFGDPTCLYCHGQGSHRIVEPTLAVIDTRPRAEGGRCSPCHLASTMETVGRIKSLLVKTEEDIEMSGRLYADLEHWGYRNLEIEQLHHHVRQVRSQLRQIFHSFNMREINNFTGEIDQAVKRTVATHELVQNLRGAQRRQAVVGGSVAVGLLVFAGLLVYYKNTFLHPDSFPSGP